MVRAGAKLKVRVRARARVRARVRGRLRPVHRPCTNVLYPYMGIWPYIIPIYGHTIMH